MCFGSDKFVWNCDFSMSILSLTVSWKLGHLECSLLRTLILAFLTQRQNWLVFSSMIFRGGVLFCFWFYCPVVTLVTDSISSNFVDSSHIIVWLTFSCILHLFIRQPDNPPDNIFWCDPSVWKDPGLFYSKRYFKTIFPYICGRTLWKNSIRPYATDLIIILPCWTFHQESNTLHIPGFIHLTGRLSSIRLYHLHTPMER